MTFRYCPICATPLAEQARGGRPRPACPACGFIQYRNPTIGVAAGVAAGVAVVLLDGGRILLGRRAPDSSYPGQWCIPCGHVEWDEDIRVAARREFEEETGLRVRVGDLIAAHSNFHNPNQQTVGIWFYGDVIHGELMAGDDLDRVAYFPLTSPPAALAFPTDRLVLAQLRGERP